MSTSKISAASGYFVCRISGSSKMKTTFNIREQQTHYIPPLKVLNEGWDVFIHTYLPPLPWLYSESCTSSQYQAISHWKIYSAIRTTYCPTSPSLQQMRYDCPVLSRLPLLEPHPWSDGISWAASFWFCVLHKSHSFLEAVGDGGLSTLLSWKPLDTNQLHGEPSLLQR